MSGFVKVCVEGAPQDVAEFLHRLPISCYTATCDVPVVSNVDVVNEVDAPAGDAPVEEAPVAAAPKAKRGRRKKVSPLEEATQEEAVQAEATQEGATQEEPAPQSEPVAEEAPVEQPVEAVDPEFADANIEGASAPEAPVQPAPEAKKVVSRAEVRNALVEYGIWLAQNGTPSSSVKPKLVALMKKFGGGAASTEELKEEYYQAVFDAAVNRTKLEEIEE